MVGTERARWGLEGGTRKKGQLGERYYNQGFLRIIVSPNYQNTRTRANPHTHPRVHSHILSHARTHERRQARSPTLTTPDTAIFPLTPHTQTNKQHKKKTIWQKQKKEIMLYAFYRIVFFYLLG